jgi:hypothetical protein
MSRNLLAVVLVAVLAGSAFGFALGGASNPPSASAASADSQIVAQLKKLNAKVSATNSNLAALRDQIGSTQTAPGSVRGLLTIICDYTASISCKP